MCALKDLDQQVKHSPTLLDQNKSMHLSYYRRVNINFNPPELVNAGKKFISFVYSSPICI
jgi:hypothetical protein